MHLLTHNMLQCTVSGCEPAKSYPFQVVANKVETTPEDEREYSAEFMARMLPRLDYPALVRVSRELSVGSLPDAMPENAAEDDAFLRELFTVCLRHKVLDGALVCRSATCGHSFPIVNGVANMMLREDQV